MRRAAAELRDAAVKLRAKAAEKKAESEQYAMEAKAADILAEQHEAIAVALEAGRLPSRDEQSTPTKVLFRVKMSRGAAISAGMTKSNTAFQRALAIYGLSIPEWAAKRRKNVETVRSWVKKPNHGGRAIPRAEADAIASEFVDPKTGESLVPAIEDAWPNGIRD